MQDYIKMFYGAKLNDRIFPVSKHYLYHEMDRGSKVTGVKRIRIHDIRHSHVSLLIDMGFSALAIADRVGHESIDITYRYAHLFPSKQKEMADQLETAVRLSGLTKQDYIIRRLQDRFVTVQGNPRVYNALRNELAAVLEQLQRIEAGNSLDEDLLDTVHMIAAIMDGMKEESDAI